jgi:hypothetical protein
VVRSVEHFLLSGPKDAKDVLKILGFYGGLGLGTLKMGLNVANVATGAVKGILHVLHQVGAREVLQARDGHDGVTQLRLDNHSALLVDTLSWNLYKRKRGIDNLDVVANPLWGDGVNYIVIKRDDVADGRITQNDLHAIDSMRYNARGTEIFQNQLSIRFTRSYRVPKLPSICGAYGMAKPK